VALPTNSAIINHDDTEALRQNITATVKELVREVEVSTLLNVQQQAVYLQAAIALQEEVNKPEPDKSAMERSLKVLNFSDSLNGALEPGEKNSYSHDDSSPLFSCDNASY